MKLYKLLFYSTMISGTLISISAYSWFSAWIGLEINLLSLIPLLKNSQNKYPSEAALKYFISQAMASSLLLFSMILSHNLMMLISEGYFMMMSMLTSSALLLKMGAAPFHFWLPEVLSGLNWSNSFIILTWQKIAPILLLAYQAKIITLFLSSIIIVSSVISGLQGLNQTCMRKIMAYSSINHVGWMIASLLNSMNICIFYFIIYCIINLNIILVLNKFHIFFLSQLSNMFNYSKMTKFIFMLNFLSLGGLPPFLGFFPKWMTINNMVNNTHYTLATLLIIFTLMSLYFYLRITFSSFTIFSEEILLYEFNKMNYMYFFINLISLLGLISSTFIDSQF